jgi:uncharacterized caspase-like protein
MRRLYLAVFLAWSVIAAGGGEARAAAIESRVALVVGNAAYRNVAPLKNPLNDARDMAKALRELGFDVIRVENANKQQLDRAIGEFSSKLTSGSVGLFYYSGHGMQENGHNYLVPVDANLATEAAVMLEATDLDLVLQIMNMAQTRVNLIILDACRDNPFEHRFRALGRGLAPIGQTSTTSWESVASAHGLPPIAGKQPPSGTRGTLIAYSTAPGRIAEDGEGANGLYTAELLKAMRVPGLKVEEVFKAVRIAVSTASKDDQTPWESSSLTGDFFFTPPAPVAAVSPPPAASADVADTAFWNSVKEDKSTAVYEEYLKAFPNGRFATLAKLKISELSVPAPRQANQAPSVPQTAASTLPRPPLGGTAEAAFHCPQPGTRIEYNNGSSMLFTGAKGFSCTYKKKNKDEAEKFDGLVDDARFVDAGLGKLWPLKVGNEQIFNIASNTDRFRVLRREDVEIEAGTFDTFVIEQEETGSGSSSGQLSAKRTFWYAPDFGLVVRSKYQRSPARWVGSNTAEGVNIQPGDYEAVRITGAAVLSEASSKTSPAPTPLPSKQASSSPQSALLPPPAPAGKSDEAAFHCPQPGTVVEYNIGTSMLFTGAKSLSCTYRKKNKDEAEKFGGLVDDARFIDAGLGKLWPLKVGGEQKFAVGSGYQRFTILRRETLTVDAGTFDTFVIEQEETATGRNAKRLFWYAPDPGLVVQSKFIRLPSAFGGFGWDDVTIPEGDYEAVRITGAAVLSEASSKTLAAATPLPSNQPPSPSQTALLTPPRPPLGESDEVAFHCPQPGTRIEYSNGTSMLFMSAKDFSCTYRKKNKDEAEKFGALVDDARFVDAGLSKLWPLKVGGEQKFPVGEAHERFTVLRRETVTVAAGTFNTFVIEQEEIGHWEDTKRIFWYAPDFGLVVQSKFAGLNVRSVGAWLFGGPTILPGDYEAVRITSIVQRLGAVQRPINSGAAMRYTLGSTPNRGD